MSIAAVFFLQGAKHCINHTPNFSPSHSPCLLAMSKPLGLWRFPDFVGFMAEVHGGSILYMPNISASTTHLHIALPLEGFTHRPLLWLDKSWAAATSYSWPWICKKHLDEEDLMSLHSLGNEIVVAAKIRNLHWYNPAVDNSASKCVRTLMPFNAFDAFAVFRVCLRKTGQPCGAWKKPFIWKFLLAHLPVSHTLVPLIMLSFSCLCEHHNWQHILLCRLEATHVLDFFGMLFKNRWWWDRWSHHDHGHQSPWDPACCVMV